MRTFFPDETYVRVDMSEGEAVGRVIDLTLPFDQINASLEGLRFGTIFCLSVMEHCDRPFRMAENLTRLLAPGGKLVVSVPFVWKFHGYPSDYWRFTHEGVKKLFPELEFPGTSATRLPLNLESGYRWTNQLGLSTLAVATSGARVGTCEPWLPMCSSLPADWGS